MQPRFLLLCCTAAFLVMPQHPLSLANGGMHPAAMPSEDSGFLPLLKSKAGLHLLPSHPYSYGPALTPPRPQYSPTKLLLGFQGFQALC